MAIWANDPGTLPRMPGPDESARGNDLNVYLDWSPGEDAEAGGPPGTAPTARGLFLGQLPDDQPDDHPDDGWTGDLPDSELFEPDATFETELVEPVEIRAAESEQSWAPLVEAAGDATAPVAPSSPRPCRASVGGRPAAPPNNGSPPSAPPRSPTCQLLPVVCP